MENISDSALIISPEFERLMTHLKSLRARLIELTLQKNELLYKKKPELLGIYARCIGNLENELEYLKIECVRVKYIIDMIRIRMQFKKEVDIQAIEKRAYSYNTEILTTNTEENTQDKKEDEADSLSNKYEEEELKIIYRRVIKLLHPDIGSDKSPAEERLLKYAIEAYEYKDVGALKGIEAALVDSSGFVTFEGEGDILEGLRNKKILLEGRIEKLTEDIKHLKAEFPFNCEKLLTDSVRMEKRQKKTEALISDERKRLEKLRNRLIYYKLKVNVEG